MNERHKYIDKRIYIITAFIILWHYFFASSFLLRLPPMIFWPAMFGIALVSLCYKKETIRGNELFLYISLFVSFFISIFSVDESASFINGMYFFVYLGVAAMIARNLSAEKVLKIILLFCIAHVCFLYMQVFLPSIYESMILPLLPPYAHADILYQMHYNSSYHGFTVQTSMIAMYMVVGAICASLLAKYETKKNKILLYLFLVGLFITGVLFATRRGSLLALIVVLSYMYFDTNKNLLSKVILLATGILFLLLLGIDNIPGMQGMLDKMDRVSGSVMNGRAEIWTTALDNFMDNPLFGYGVGKSLDAGGGSLIDNAYLATLAERGIVGTVTWFIPLILIFLLTYIRKKSKYIKSNLALDFSFYIQLLFIIMSCVENYFGQALAMFIYYLAVLCADFSKMRGNLHENH